MKKLLQTKEDIRRKMMDMFVNSLPTIKNATNFPIIVVGEAKSPPSPNYNIHWIWLLQNYQAITYGENGQNRFIFYPEYKKPIHAANFNIKEEFEIIPQSTSDISKDLTASIEVKHLRYPSKNKEVYYEDAAIVFTPASVEPAEISKLYYRETECEYI